MGSTRKLGLQQLRGLGLTAAAQEAGPPVTSPSPVDPMVSTSDLVHQWNEASFFFQNNTNSLAQCVLV